MHARQPAYAPLGHAIGGVDARRVGRLDEVVADDVDDPLARVEQVPQRVLGPLDGGREADDQDGRVVAHDVEVAEGGEVGGGPVARERRQEGDWAGDDGRDEQLVVEGRGALGVAGVDGDVARARRRRGRVGARAERPRRRGGLGVCEGGVGRRRARGLHLVEVGMRVAVDAVGHGQGAVVGAVVGAFGHELGGHAGAGADARHSRKEDEQVSEWCVLLTTKGGGMGGML